MIGATSVRHSRPRPHSAMKTLKRCENVGDDESIVLIDVDSDGFDSVIVIDVPENLTKKLRSSSALRKDEKRTLKTYIYIDDDEIPDDQHPKGQPKGGASSSRYSRPTNTPPFKLSKCKRTYSGKDSTNRFCLTTDSDDSSSDNDGPDIEFMEDFSGPLREQWEKAFLKRNAQSDKSDQGIASTLNSDGHQNINSENGKQSSSRKVNEEKENQHPVSTDGEKSERTCDTQKAEKEPVAEDPSCSNSQQKAPASFVIDPRGETGVFQPPVSLHENGEQCSDENEDDMESVEVSILNEREKQKETDEYRRAQEEEWLARERELKIQAEAAQELRRLQKRKKAESLRLVDMERRQKQRVEEMRKIQLEDAVNMNLRELHRAEVTKELKKLENASRDMASVLRGLGIQVGVGLYPSSDEVRTACKKALFSFHPDRASGSDVRQQVEAEEKFKLISRMKEKFLPN